MKIDTKRIRENSLSIWKLENISNAYVVNMILSMSIAAFVYVLGLHTIMKLFSAFNLYEDSLFKALILAFTLSLPIAPSTYVYFLTRDGFVGKENAVDDPWDGEVPY